MSLLFNMHNQATINLQYTIYQWDLIQRPFFTSIQCSRSKKLNRCGNADHYNKKIGLLCVSERTSWSQMSPSSRPSRNYVELSINYNILANTACKDNAEEAYHIEITQSHVTVSAKTSTGIFYGVQVSTLLTDQMTNRILCCNVFTRLGPCLIIESDAVS